MREFTSERGDANVSDAFARPGSKYLVIDIGGGTLDVTAHEILTNGNIKEIHQVTGGPYMVEQKLTRSSCPCLRGSLELLW
ncbi:hypothetical protein OS493_032626 [Desmophyllum pertusum]|uniref:Uncharacterized protein n=1 Tax=Desmophyllum pertusum TaxID=174260 RepID=A0A9W9YJG4_9CNID|nr:hypothetical protein OS493_032626 [Desmophyllum pertusum]